jgi:signal peptide peptidase SppA
VDPIAAPRRAAGIAEQPLTSTWAVRHDVLDIVAQRIAHPLAIADPQAAVATSADVPVTGGVAVISLRGLLTARPSLMSLLFGGGGGGLALFRSCLREAMGSEEIGSVLLDIDSPGGSTDLMAEVSEEIRGYRGEKPIIALANVQACSGAYWLASAADEVVITPSGRMGSIGVYIVHLDESGLEERIGIKSTYVSAGRYKVEGNSSEALTEEAEAALQEIVDDYYALFVECVAAGRGVTKSDVEGGMGEGRVLTAKAAVAAGLADRVDSFEGVVSKLAGTESRGPRSTTSLRVEMNPALAAPHTTTSNTEDQLDDKPVPKAPDAEEGRARIAQLTNAVSPLNRKDKSAR